METLESQVLSSYEAPIVEIEHLAAEEEPAPVWAIIVGGSIGLAYLYGWYCTRSGGQYSISFSWTRGFKVVCWR